ncbi:uncharacterized protein LOC111018103 [Momordica charantia]|uniref:Uncharacterized protein LOC111018103 n=1 Tax=Momordica charantia TaxID=3673 RepID=A0A6J1D9B5_MOMCH|nr:uncharacterized protein LOC111018103 [Momordica charantia]
MPKHGNKLKAWNKQQTISILIVSAFLILFVLMMLFRKESHERNLLFEGTPKQTWDSFNSLVQFNPNREFRSGTDLISQVPDSPKAVLFVAHGCNGKAVNFWDKSAKCPSCVGLPEERLIVLHALSRHFAVLTISSSRKCWTFGKELAVVKDIIRWWVEKNNLEKIPLVGLGASSGGYFLSVLATELKFNSITLMIAEGLYEQMDVTERYPPTLFIHMPKDQFREKKINENMKFLRSKGVDVAEIECLEFALSPNFFADRIPELDKSVSAKLFELFQAKGFVDGNGKMLKDGRATRWKEALRMSGISVPDNNLTHHIQEEMNLAFAYHEMTSLEADQIFTWFESHLR